MVLAFERIASRAVRRKAPIQISQVDLVTPYATCQHAFTLSRYAYTSIGARGRGIEKSHQELMRESAGLECNCEFSSIGEAVRSNVWNRVDSDPHVNGATRRSERSNA